MTGRIPTRMRALAGAAVVGAAMTMSACASGLGANDYSRGQVGAVSRVEPAVVVEARPVNIEGAKSGVGTVAGAAIGGVAGSQIGGGRFENTLGGIAGAVAGGLAGAAIEEGVTRQTGTAYTVRVERTGEFMTITQADTGYVFPPGTAVFIEYGPRTRIVPRSGGGYPSAGYQPGGYNGGGYR